MFLEGGWMFEKNIIEKTFILTYFANPPCPVHELYNNNLI